MSFNRTELTDAENHGASGVNRRAFFGLALASSAALALAACSSETTTTTTSGGSTSGGNSGTRTIKDIDDENVEVPANPQKVIVLSEPTLDGLLALGVTPVGSVSGRGQSGVPNYLADRAKGVQIIGTVAQVNYEQIGNLDPDLILVDSTGVDKRSEAFETLKKIAPVVYCGYAGGDWRINFRNVANAMNMVDKGEEVIKAYESNAAALKDQLAPKYGDKTFSIVRWAGNGPALILKNCLPARYSTTWASSAPRRRTATARATPNRSLWRTWQPSTRTTCSSVPSAAQARRTRTHRVPQVCRAPKKH